MRSHLEVSHLCVGTQDLNMQSVGVLVFLKAFALCFQEISVSGYINMHSQI